MSTQITIQSRATPSNSFVGPNVTLGQATAPVQLNSPDDNVWILSKDGHYLGVVFLPYSGVDDEQGVIATDDSSQNVQWNINTVSDCGQPDSSESYFATIADYNSGMLWTVSDPSEENSLIVVQDPSDLQCDPRQLFEISY